MVKPKPKSKRTPVRLRHKIEKASAAKQRKQRKISKSNPEWRTRLKKDPGIPNLFPYKEKLLHQIEENKRLKAEEIAQKRQQAKSLMNSTEFDGGGSDGIENRTEDSMGSEAFPSDDEMEDDDGSNPMAALLASAKARAIEYEAENGVDNVEDMDEDDEDDEDMIGGVGRNPITNEQIPVAPTRKDVSRKAFDKVFKQVVDTADVVLYVLDARDPEGTRSKEVERMIMAAEGGQKRLILVLNKIDLIPSKALREWLVHLRRYFPTLPLRASGPAPNAHTFNHHQLTTKATSSTLFKALKSFAHSKQLKRSITVGIIGYPNVGKSSVINALTSKLGGSHSACPTGAEAGVTTSLRQVKLDNKLKLLDSPGIVFPSTSENIKLPQIEEQARLVLLNAVPPKQIEDPVPAVALLLKRMSANPDLLSKLLDVYGLPPLMAIDGDQTTDFLIQVARKRGRLGKGGVPNIASAATTVITDWRDGRIQGWAEAPRLQVEGSTSAEDSTSKTENSTIVPDQKEIVNEWAKEFKLEGLWGEDAISNEAIDS